MAGDTRAWARVKNGGVSLDGDASLHLTPSQLATAMAEAEVSFVANWGSVEAVVIRTITGGRKQPVSATITVKEGLVGDRWSSGKARPGDQISMMNLDVAAAIANGQSIVLFGDNLFTRLDLRQASFPVGSQIQIGGALVEVSAMPHGPCAQFCARFGAAAFAYTARIPQARGLYLTVITGGDIAIGDPIVRA